MNFYLLGSTLSKIALISEFVRSFVMGKKAFQLLDIHRNTHIGQISYKSFRERIITRVTAEGGTRGITERMLSATNISRILINWYVKTVFLVPTYKKPAAPPS